MTEKPKITFDLSQVIKNVKGEIVKDMIDPGAGITEANAPNLTLGSILANAFSIGVGGLRPKEAGEFLNFAYRFQDALANKQGKIELDDAEIARIEEMYGKVSVPLFTMALYAGNVSMALNKAKMELLRKSNKPE